jgi:hypothetical protein
MGNIFRLVAFCSVFRGAAVQKLYGRDPSGERRHSPAVCTGIDIDVRNGDPDPAKAPTLRLDY